MVGEEAGYTGITAVTGATGWIGRALVQDLLRSGHRVVVVSRDPGRDPKSLFPGAEAEPPEIWGWDTLTDQARHRRVRVWVHLAGEPIAGRRWSRRQKAAIRRSREETTRRVVDALAAARDRDEFRPVLVSASAVGYYGTSETAEFSEDDPGGEDFLAAVSKAWEDEARRAEQYGARVVRVRLGVVLGRDGGALPRMALPYRLGMGGRLGSGRQWVSWIHVADAVGIFRYVLEHPVQGAVNAVSPHPVTMDTFGRTLARALRRPYWLPVPEAALRAVFGEGADVLLKGQRVLPKRAKEWGYSFQYPDLSGALAEILDRT